MKRILSLLNLAALLTCTLLPATAADTLTLTPVDSLQLTNRYTVELKGAQLKKAQEGFSVTTTCLYGSLYKGVTTYIGSQNIYYLKNGQDTTYLAKGLPIDSKAHTYTWVRSTILKLYRDGILMGTLYESTVDSCQTSLNQCENLLAGFTATVISRTEAIAPEEDATETHIDELLCSQSEKLKNLAPDPYCNYGFTQTGEDTNDLYYTANAKFGVTGGYAEMETADTYSGPYAIRLQSASTDPSEKVMLEQAISFTAGTPYLIRCRVKSEGAEGKLFIQGEKPYLTIPDTKGEWKLVEGMLAPTKKASNLQMEGMFLSAQSYLLLDQMEVYLGYATTNKVFSTYTEVPAVQLTAGQNWSPKNCTNVYGLAFTETATAYSQIDTTTVKLKGATALIRTVKGSEMVPLYFPGNLHAATATGRYDATTHTGEPLTLGIDYLLQRYEYPRFEFVERDEDIKAGCYLAQFVDNLEGIPVTLNFGSLATVTEGPDTPYRMVGNPHFCDFVPEGKFLRFNATTQRFELTKGETLRPFEAYIETDETNPVGSIVTGYHTRLQQLASDEEVPFSIQWGKGTLTLRSAADTELTVYTLMGQAVTTVHLSAQTAQTVVLQPGIYLLNHTKIVLR